MPNITVQKTVDNLDRMLERVQTLTGNEVLVGFPAEKAARKDGPVTNAALGYIHEFGSPIRNIPARPFLLPGIRKADEKIVELLKNGAREAMAAGGGSNSAMRTLKAVGMTARNSVVRAITDPEPPFVPLKPATVRARLRKTAAGRRKLKRLGQIKAAAEWNATKANEALSMWAEAGNIKPLIDTGQLRAAVTYVIRPARDAAQKLRDRNDARKRIISSDVNEQKYRAQAAQTIYTTR